jgi:hypothetical protein
MWVASASSASELIISAVVSSTTKKTPRIAEAMIMRLTRVSALPWRCPAPMAEIYWSWPWSSSAST